MQLRKYSQINSETEYNTFSYLWFTLCEPAFNFQFIFAGMWIKCMT